MWSMDKPGRRRDNGRFEEIVDLLKLYKALHVNEGNTFTIPQSFQIPRNESIWPERTWGIKIGSFFVKNGGASSLKQR